MYNTVSRFAVPCFIMMSGAYILSNSENKNYILFYKKSFMKIGVHTLIFMVMYILYRILLCFIGEGDGIQEMLSLGKDIIKGAPMYHMWYMYMLIGLYALAPICIRFKNSVSKHTFEKVAFIFLIVASLSRWTTGNIRMHWNAGQSFEYLGYFMIGFVLRDQTKEKKSNKRGFYLYWPEL